MSGRWLNLKILEIGEFCLFKRNFADQTTLVFTGDNDRTVQGLDYLSFSPGMLPGLLRSLRREHWDIVVCYPPARTLWDCRQAPARGAIDLVRRVAAFRPLGTYAIRAFRRRLEGRLVVLDYNDEATIPTPALPLLDACNAYFKRELPTDFAKAFRAAARRYRTPGDVVVDPFFQRNAHKLRPISAAVPESVARRAQEARGEKTTDLFFAGSTVNSTVRSRGFELLKALQGQGYVLDLSMDRMPHQEYLERCARAWLTWSPEGYGWECFRHFEASLCRSVPILSQPGICRYQPLLDGIHAWYYRPEGESLREVVVKALADKASLESMAQAAYEHTLRFHTQRRACDYILETVRGTGGKPDCA